MKDHYESAGYENCVLNSNDDYEPYGYVPTETQDRVWQQPRLQLRETPLQQRNPAFDRVIEAQLLASSSMVGC
ncbi:MAG: hypothetical protein WBM40_22950 [Thiohalocapsa sp.]